MSVRVDADVEVKIGIAFGHRPLSTAPVFVDVSTSVKEVHISRGRTSRINRFDAGIMSVTLDNNDGKFDPNNTASTHSPNILVNVPIRVQAIHSGTTYDLFRGVVESWPPTYPGMGAYSDTIVSAVDDFATLSHALSLSTFAEEATHTRLDTILDNIGWSTSRRSLDVGLSFQQAETITSTGVGLARMNAAVDGEMGTLWMSKSGDVTFRNRIKFSGGVTPPSTFGPSALKYRDVTPAYDNTYLFNDVRVTRTGGVEQIALSTASIDKHGAVTLSKKTVQATDVEAMNTAEWMSVVYGEQRVRVDRLEVSPRSDTDLWPTILGADFDSTLKIRINPPGSGTNLNQDVVVQGIEHRFSPLKWDTVIHSRTLTATETATYWVLGTAALDTDTRLA